jgi:hypothetical protein
VIPERIEESLGVPEKSEASLATANWRWVWVYWLS